MKEYIFKQYLDNILDHLNIKIEDLLIKTKERRMTEARFLLYYLCHKRGIKMVEIQSYMKSQGYDVALSIIKYGLDRAKEIIENDSDQMLIDKEGWLHGVFKLTLEKYKIKLDRIKLGISSELNGNKSNKRLTFYKEARQQILNKYYKVTQKLTKIKTNAN